MSWVDLGISWVSSFFLAKWEEYLPCSNLSRTCVLLRISWVFIKIQIWDLRSRPPKNSLPLLLFLAAQRALHQNYTIITMSYFPFVFAVFHFAPMILESELSRSFQRGGSVYPEGLAGIIRQTKKTTQSLSPSFTHQTTLPSLKLQEDGLLLCSLKEWGYVPAAWASIGSRLETWGPRPPLRPSESEAAAWLESPTVLWEQHRSSEYLCVKILFRCGVLLKLW